MFIARVSVLAAAGLAAFLGLIDRTPPGAPPPTFAKDIAPILYKRCASCHSDSRIAPFSLVGYENARQRALTIAKVTEQGYMPPWKAKHGYGEFRDVQSLTPNEKKLFTEWAAGGAPAGNLSEAPTPPIVVPGWRLGKPDLIISPEKATKIPATGRDFFRDYMIDPHITKPTWVRAIDFQPSNQGTVHHIIPSLMVKEEADKLRKVKFDFDDNSWKSVDVETYNTLGFWSTGAPPFLSPDGTAFLIKPGDCFLLNVHYKPKGKPEMEQPQVAL
ncbi:MAG: hypothetical protein K8R88_08745 [Armatimonadetes bacterium]|nr:hypothetical protein [Armatimonadota bacterium]